MNPRLGVVPYDSLRMVLESPWTQDSNDRQLCGLLRMRRQYRHRAAEKRDELAAIHSITSSARPSNVNEKVRPSVLGSLAPMRRMG